MAAYYGWTQGSRGAAHRIGGLQGGVTAGVKSWSHSLTTHMYQDQTTKDGGDYVRIELNGKHGDTLASWQGTPAELARKLKAKK